jgi:hypothetical protein
METGPFIGRVKELEQLLRELGRVPDASQPERSAVVWGPRGIGKSRLIQEVVAQLLKQNAPVYWFGLGLKSPASDLAKFSLALAESFQCNRVPSDVQSTELITTIKRLLPAAQPVPTAEGHAISNSALVDQSPAAVITPIEVAEIFAEGLLRTFYQVGSAQKDRVAGRDFPLIFLADDYDGFSLELKAMLLQLRDRLLSLRGYIRARFLIVSQQPLALTGWGGVPDLLELELGPFDREETAEYLARCQVTNVSASTIHANSMGNPGLIEQLVLGQAAQPSAAKPEDAAVRELVQHLKPIEREYLVAAAFLENCTQEGLALFGGRDYGEKVFDWLAQLPTAQVKATLNGKLELQPSLSEAVRRMTADEHPELSHDYAQRVSLFQQWLQLIPEKNHRQRLYLLAPFAHFTKSLLERTLPSQAQDLWEFCQQYPSYFIETPHTRSIVDTLRPLAQSCGYWLDAPGYERTQEALKEAWQQQRKAIVTEITALEKELAENERQRQTLCGEIQKVQREIDDRAQRLVIESPRPASTGLLTAGRPRSLKSALATQALGVASIYAGLLLISSAREMAYTYMGIGLYFFIWGLYNSRSPRPQTSPEFADTGLSIELSDSLLQQQIRQAEGDLNIVQLRSITLENRQKHLFSTYARDNRRLNECYEKLSEVFV